MTRAHGDMATRDAAEVAGETVTIFNTLSRQKEPIIPLEPGLVRMYSCGPTVYRFIHIGNLRTFVMADWLRRTLTAHGLQVTHVKNITDVGHMRQERLDQGEDKMITQARHEGKSPWDIAAFYTEAFMHDEQLMHILPAQVFPRATEHIPEMIALTQRLLDRGVAYAAGGNVFFSVASFPGYGDLSGNILENLGQGQHTNNENDPYKHAPEDFPLWKVAEPGRIMAWDSPWGRGFPGWHIECSAMSFKYLGEQFDIHTGGVDNIFPHHEDERAQSEAASGEQFVRYWVHAQHLLADGLKMAKSSGNAYTLADVMQRGFDPMDLRYFFTTASYRSRINFTFRALQAARVAYRRLIWHAAHLRDQASDTTVAAAAIADHPYRRDFMAAVDDDLNMPRAMATIWGMLRDTTIDPATRLAILLDADTILGFDLATTLTQVDANGLIPVPVPPAVRTTIATRGMARSGQDYPTADALRTTIQDEGFELRDGVVATTVVPREDRDVLISSSGDVPSQLAAPPRYAFSINLLAHENLEDLRRCIQSVVRHRGQQSLELVILDNGSADETLTYLREMQRAGQVDGIPVRVIFADHDMGFAAGRNAQFRASQGAIIVQIDTSIEVNGDLWTPIAALLAQPDIGLIGPYGLVTRDLKEFAESEGPDVDAIEGYLMAFRRETLLEVGPADEKFRFYRLMDIDYSFEFKKAGFRVVRSAEIAALVIKHDHREWYALTEEERQTKSKKNFDIFRRKRHHCESLLVMHFAPGQPAPWGHDQEMAAGDLIDPHFEHVHVDGDQAHSHEHKHWPDHSHTHTHVHRATPRWYAPDQLARYAPHFQTSDAPASPIKDAPHE